MVESNDLILGPGECSPVEPGSEEEEGYACIVIVKIVWLHTQRMLPICSGLAYVCVPC
ncbi:MAG: hypothetical protein ACRD8Z_04975 [Nitrososphaeraceae archaeon]